MGFGNGTRTYHGRDSGYDKETGRRVASVLSNDMVAHVWNAQSQTFGRSNNGNFYFEGPTLYSYGSHFPVGVIVPDGTAILNSDSYSVSTSGHQSDARGAVRNRRTVAIPNLKEALNGGLLLIERMADPEWRGDKREALATIKRSLRSYILANAEALATARVYAPGESSWGRDEEAGKSFTRDGIETAGAYLTRLAGLPAASWPKLARDAAKAAERKAKADKAAARKRAKAEALQAADMPDSRFRDIAREYLTRYDPEEALGELAKRFFRYKRTAKAEGFSARRMDSIRLREKRLREMKADAARLSAMVNDRRQLRSDIAAVRVAAGTVREIGTSQARPDYQTARRITDAAAALNRLAERPLFPFVSRRRMAVAADKLTGVVEALAADRLADQEREREARALEIAEFRAKWLAGTVPLVRHFDAESGGAALRIVGDRLETSHGAQVPLAHAVRAFRFVKLCKALHRAWKRNGERIRVGSFEVDSISETGDMVAGCHSFTWPEIERAARVAHVADAEASAEAVEHREGVTA